jgi:hypothetical protein
VLRVPGSHNTKNGAWTEVEVLTFEPNRRYELDDLEEWFGVPAGLSIGAHIMATEASGVLNWALEGLRSLLERGLFDVPDAVTNDIREFKEGNNPVAEFARIAAPRRRTSKSSSATCCVSYHGWVREEMGEEARASGAR